MKKRTKKLLRLASSGSLGPAWIKVFWFFFSKKNCFLPYLMETLVTDITPEFRLGWDAALLAVRDWHRSQAKKALVQAGRSRFPKNLEREAEVHERSAELILVLSPDDV